MILEVFCMDLFLYRGQYIYIYIYIYIFFF